MSVQRWLRWRSMVLAAALLLASCEFPGVQGYQVQVVNKASVPVTYYVVDASDAKFPGVRLQPGSTQWNQWTYPRPLREEKLPTVSAFDDSGTPVFCKRYTFEQIKDRQYRVEIEEGVIECVASRG